MRNQGKITSYEEYLKLVTNLRHRSGDIRCVYRCWYPHRTTKNEERIFYFLCRALGYWSGDCVEKINIITKLQLPPTCEMSDSVPLKTSEIVVSNDRSIFQVDFVWNGGEGYTREVDRITRLTPKGLQSVLLKLKAKIKKETKAILRRIEVFEIYSSGKGEINE